MPFLDWYINNFSRQYDGNNMMEIYPETPGGGGGPNPDVPPPGTTPEPPGGTNPVNPPTDPPGPTPPGADTTLGDLLRAAAVDGSGDNYGGLSVSGTGAQKANPVLAVVIVLAVLAAGFFGYRWYKKHG